MSLFAVTASCLRNEEMVKFKFNILLSGRYFLKFCGLLPNRPRDCQAVCVSSLVITLNIILIWRCNLLLIGYLIGDFILLLYYITLICFLNTMSNNQYEHCIF